MYNCKIKPFDIGVKLPPMQSYVACIRTLQRIMFSQDLVIFVHQQTATIDKQSELIQQLQDEASVSLILCLIKLIL